jgi:hypothetical protein
MKTHTTYGTQGFITMFTRAQHYSNPHSHNLIAYTEYISFLWAGQLSRYSDWLRAARARLDFQERQVPGIPGTFPPTTTSRQALGPTQSPIELISGALSPGVKRREETDHLPSSRLKRRVKNVLSYTSTPPYVFAARHFNLFYLYINSFSSNAYYLVQYS